MPSSRLILCRLLLLPPSIFPSIRIFSNELAFRNRWPKYWSFSLSISPSNEYSGLVSLGIDGFDLLAIQGTLKSFLQHHSWKASILRHSAFFMVQLSRPYMTTEKPVALTRQTFVGKVMSLLFNALSRMLCPVKSQRSHMRGDGSSGLGAQGPLGEGQTPHSWIAGGGGGWGECCDPPLTPRPRAVPRSPHSDDSGRAQAPSNSWRQLGSPKSTRGRSQEGPVSEVAGRCAVVACAFQGGTRRCHFHPTPGPQLCRKSWRLTGFAHFPPLSFVGRSTPGTPSYPFMASLAPFQSLNPEKAELQHSPVPVQESGVCPLLSGLCQIWAGCLRGTEEG